ncbi:MAG: addiction module protein [Spirochaetia bacterium]|nr:addiction module protein [Spirochaetia bacterium]
MSIESALEEIKRQDINTKFAILDSLWDDIAENVINEKIPVSHKVMLDERLSAIKSGKAGFQSWETVKKRLLGDKEH